MKQDSKLVQPLNSADARHPINKWSSQGFFRVRGFGGKIAIEDIVPCSSCTVRLQSQYEDRRDSLSKQRPRRTLVFTVCYQTKQ
jgi:hypothetical protein